MPLTKIQEIKQRKELDNIKNTHPNLKVINHLEFARLFKPEIFVYPNQNRLFRQVTDKIIQSLDDFFYAFKKLPQSYKEEIILNPEFSSMINMVFSAGQITRQTKRERDKTKEDENNSITTDIYQKFFNIGLEGLIKTLPYEFGPYLKSEMKPLLLLMLAISKTTTTKKPISLEFPKWVYD